MMVKRYESGKEDLDYNNNIWTPVLIVWSLIVVVAFVASAVNILVG